MVEALDVPSPQLRDSWCPPLYFIDGLYLGNARTVHVDQLLAPEQVEGVEVYSGAGNLPPEFNRTDSQCGVIAFWTR
ncbi:MAG: hypothetical protein HYW52_02690 [Gemmatimonadetes bacterium]|nr:hypothetical protein [Gemmatimonadota bacterium]